MSAGLVVKFFSVLFLLLTYIVYKPPASQIEDQPPVEIVSGQSYIIIILVEEILLYNNISDFFILDRNYWWPVHEKVTPKIGKYI